MIQTAPAAAESQATVAEYLLRYLAQRGITHVFGVVGREAAAILFDEPNAPEFILTRHEFTAGVAADVQARITGTPAACFATLGPGITNLSTAVACAFLDRSPLIAIGAQAETTDGVPGQTHQCIDNVALMRPITKYSAEIRSADELVPELEKCLAVAMEEPLGPAFISIPIDVLSSTMPPGTSAAQ
ncbi:MAG: Acetolactate synthase large subunit, partial [Candidatus Eremiobacteraeota bacterium]|nr:Acetolactate synthase large subunit [Candidatus Eremiobacteraeota bacterium]